MWLSKDDAYSYTNLVVNMTEPPLDEPLRRDAKRKVSLIELLDAFDLARKESEEHQLLEQQRKEERERLAEKARKRMKGTAVEDHLEEDVVDIWTRIKEFPNKTMSLGDLCSKKGKEELIRVLISVLFLAYDNKVVVYQKRFPFGKIFIKNLRYS
jgi:chromatin segregation and condensation protein Rec8/ScpA/Scc1 (kleisin family)